MINPKKTIPKLAGAILALTGAQACGGDGGGATSQDVANAINNFCMKAVNQCGAPFTVQECAEGLAAYYGLGSLNGTPQCYGAIVSYANCITGRSCEEIQAWYNNEAEPCASLYGPIYQNC